MQRQRRLPSFTLLSSLAGEAVSVVGFGVFGQACGPSVTSGILSAVVQVDDTPVMLQTTCAVHGGSSGGPLFSTRTGDLLGNQLLGPLPAPPLPEPQSHLVRAGRAAPGSHPRPGKMVGLTPKRQLAKVFGHLCSWEWRGADAEQGGKRSEV